MICTTCGSQIPDNSSSCPNCGQAFVYGNMQQAGQPYVNQQYVNQQYVNQNYENQQYVEQNIGSQEAINVDTDEVKKIFSDTNEEYVTSLGNSYLQSFLFNGSLSKGFCTVSNKRVYFNGTTYSIATANNGKKRARRFRSSKIIDLFDVTGTGSENIIDIFKLIFAYFLLVLTSIFAAGMLTWGIVLLSADGAVGLLPLLGMGVFLLVDWLISKWIKALKTKTFIVIQYAGGEIAFDAKWYIKEEVDKFQKELRVAKDKAQEVKEKAMANQLQNALQSSNAQNPAQASNFAYSKSTSNADELTKYADLFNKGLISEEEFNSIKQQIISKI